MADLVALRSRLIALRHDALQRLAEADVLDGGMLALLGNTLARCPVGPAYAHAREAQRMRMTAPAAARAIVSDDGCEIRWVVYREAKTVAVVVLDPLRAIAIAGELIAAASRRLEGGDAVRRRGGDPKAAHRRERDAALRELAPLVAGGLSVERQARAIIER